MGLKHGNWQFLCASSVVFALLIGVSHSQIIRPNVELIENGTSYRFTNAQDKGVITALSDGTVITDTWDGRPEQQWTLIEHFRDPYCLEFINYAVPYNDLSGYEPPPEQPEVFPRILCLTKYQIMPDLHDKTGAGFLGNDDDDFVVNWRVVIRNRWCLESRGFGQRLTIDDCEWEIMPKQYWHLEIIPPS